MPRFLHTLAALLLLAPAALAQSGTAQSDHADLSVQKSLQHNGDTSFEYFLGDEATFFIAVTNHGPDAASAVAVADVLPDGLFYLRATAERGHYDAATGTWAVGDLAVGETKTLTLTTAFAAEAPVQNCAGVHASDQADGDASNNTACAPYVRPKREKMLPLTGLDTASTLF